jgi:hypothetical protein
MATISGDLSTQFFKKSIRANTSNITLDSNMIRLLVAIDENKDMAQVANETDMDPITLRTVLSRLLDSGLVEAVEKTVRYLDRTFYDIMRRTLALAVGPMSDLILEDIMADMGISFEKIPVHRAADLVGKVGQQIPDQEDRTRFEGSMLKIIPA